MTGEQVSDLLMKGIILVNVIFYSWLLGAIIYTVYKIIKGSKK